jgi:hypothetical protein
MSDYERGPYTPPSDRLAFDRRQPERGGGPAPVTLIVSALVLAAIVGGVFLVYRGGIRHKGAPTAVGVPLADIKSPAPTGESVNAAPAALVIDKSDASANAAPAFAPPPEEPLPRPKPVAPPPVAATPVQATPVRATPAQAAPSPATASPTAPSPAAAPVAKPAVTAAKPLTIASLANAALENGPPVKPAPRVAAAAAPMMTATATPAAGWAQIGSFTSAALADKGWRDTVAFAPAVMAGKGKQVQPASVNGKTYYRTFVTGFPSRAAAEAFCGKLTAAKKPCIVK